ATAATNLVLPTSSHKTALVPVFPASVRGLMAGLYGIDFEVNVRAAGRYADERYFETGPFRVPAGVRVYSPPRTCVSPSVLIACPRIGQAGSYDCSQ
ncbi:MAG TPA: hypothetical protein VFI16_11595, partial [Anaeromyxobacteraceae bacterium]|nr:hypothetical protein [Anaeromyxobacteraceae bacterium]